MSLFQPVSYPFIWADGADVNVLRAAQDIAASRDVLVELFEHVRYFLKRLDIDTEVIVYYRHNHRYHSGST